MSNHSNDLRKRVVNFFNLGNTANKTSKIFQVSKDTVKKWVGWEKTGELFRVRNWQSMSKLDTKRILDYVDKNPDKYNYEIAEVFNSSKSAIQRLLAKNGYTVKKKQKSIKKPIQ
jgi:transposase